MDEDDLRNDLGFNETANAAADSDDELVSLFIFGREDKRFGQRLLKTNPINKNSRYDSGSIPAVEALTGPRDGSKPPV